MRQRFSILLGSAAVAFAAATEALAGTLACASSSTIALGLSGR